MQKETMPFANIRFLFCKWCGDSHYMKKVNLSSEVEFDDEGGGYEYVVHTYQCPACERELEMTEPIGYF